MVLTTGRRNGRDRGAATPRALRPRGARRGARPADPGAVRAARRPRGASPDLHDAGATPIGIHVESLDDEVRRTLDAGKSTGARWPSTGPRGTRRSGSSARTRCRPTCWSGSARTPTNWSPARPSSSSWASTPSSCRSARWPAPSPSTSTARPPRTRRVVATSPPGRRAPACGRVCGRRPERRLCGVRRVQRAVRRREAEHDDDLTDRRAPRCRRGSSTGGPAARRTAWSSRPRPTADLARLPRGSGTQVFVAEQQLFATHATSTTSTHDPRTGRARRPGRRTARCSAASGSHPVDDRTDLGWWTGSRLVVAPGAAAPVAASAPRWSAPRVRRPRARGVLRFDATVQARNETLFTRLGWQPCATGRRSQGRRTCACDWPIGRFARLARATKAPLGDARCAAVAPAGSGPLRRRRRRAGARDSDLVAACDAILPAMVERDPEWAGWCAVLVNVNDLAAMGAAPVGAARRRRRPRRLVRPPGDARAARRRRRLGRAGARRTHPARRARGAVRHRARPHDAPVAGRRRPCRPRRCGSPPTSTASWRPGYTGRQWDSTSRAQPDELRAMLAAGRAGRCTRPAAPRTSRWPASSARTGMLAEASGTGAVLDVAAVPEPAARDRRRLADLLPRLRDGHRRRAGRPRTPVRVRRRPRCAASSPTRRRRGAALARRRASPSRRGRVTGLGAGIEEQP